VQLRSEHPLFWKGEEGGRGGTYGVKNSDRFYSGVRLDGEGKEHKKKGMAGPRILIPRSKRGKKGRNGKGRKAGIADLASPPFLRVEAGGEKGGKGM